MTKNDVPQQFKKFVFPVRRFVGKTTEQAERRYLKWHDRNPDVQVFVYMFLPKESLPHKLKSVKHTNVHVLQVTFARVKNRTRVTFRGAEKDVRHQIEGWQKNNPEHVIVGECVACRPAAKEGQLIHDIFYVSTARKSCG